MSPMISAGQAGIPVEAEIRIRNVATIGSGKIVGAQGRTSLSRLWQQQGKFVFSNLKPSLKTIFEEGKLNLGAEESSKIDLESSAFRRICPPRKKPGKGSEEGSHRRHEPHER